MNGLQPELDWPKDLDAELVEVPWGIHSRLGAEAFAYFKLIERIP